LLLSRSAGDDITPPKTHYRIGPDPKANVISA
jgi:hypothetical protein